jgi:putative addiction module component (TIGR02574 family)
MTPTIQSLGLDKLSPADQLSLVHDLWDHIAATGPGPRLSDAQRADLRRRVAEDEANPEDAIPWEQVKADARARFAK